MFYGRVIGTTVATVKDEKLKGFKLLIVQRTNYEGEEEGEPIIAVDAVQAGIDDFVFLAKGKEAALPLRKKGISVDEALKNKGAPVDAAIIGIIDRVSVEK